jgi:hypothetical protein
VNGNGNARAAAAAAAIRSVAWRSSNIGASELPVASSIEQPTSPISAASLIVSATISGRVPETLLKVGGDGQIGGIADHPALGQCLVACHPAVTPTEQTR